MQPTKAAEPQSELAVTPSFLVLPFASPSSEQSYVAANVTGDLTAGLSAIPESVVIAPSSARAIATQTPALTALGRDFGVHYVVQGSAAREGAHLHVAATLIRTDNGKELWSKQFERDFTALRALESEIVAGIAQQLGVPLGNPNPPAGLLSMQDVAALDSLMRAKALADGPTTAQTLAEQNRLFSAALASPSLAAEAKVGLAAIRLALALGARSGPPASDLAECDRLLQEALASDPRNGRALGTLGALRRATGKPREALAAYETAVAADRNDANAHAQIGRLMIEIGEPQNALAHIELALRLSPLDAQRTLWFTFAGLASLHLGDPRTARTWLERATASAPRFVTALVFLAAAQELEGQDMDARRTVSAARGINPALSVARVEQQFAPVDRASGRWQAIREALHQAGLPN
jgi:TolB-like protein/Tfp pilus assembly protein PilF